MNKEVEELLNKLGENEDAPMIWINKKVYDAPRIIKEQQQRIDKAIKYIKKYRDDRDGELYLLMSETDDLLEILKGENNE